MVAVELSGAKGVRNCRIHAAGSEETRVRVVAKGMGAAGRGCSSPELDYKN